VDHLTPLAGSTLESLAMVKTDIRVIYGDTDQMGFVYYANYLRFFEAGRNEYLRARGVPYRQIEAELGVRLPVVECGIHYKASARYDDLLVVETSIVQIRRASARFEYAIRRGGELLVTGHTVHACIDFDGAICRLPDGLVGRLAE
jgi:acyl-CoA thioester hydrolase